MPLGSIDRDMLMLVSVACRRYLLSAAVACCRSCFLLLVASASCSWLALLVLLIVDLGAMLGLSWAVLGRLCTVLEFSGDRLGPSWGRPGALSRAV